MSGPQPIEVSVIIPARNEEAMIAGSLESLSAMDFPVDAMEVIVADNGSTDRTVETAMAFAGRLNIQVVSVPGARVSGVRNAGARRARGRILAFLDADCLVPRDWLREATAFFNSEDPAVIGAPYLPPRGAGWVADAWWFFRSRREGRTASFVSTAGMLLRADDFWRVEGFDESLATAEDWDLCARLREAGVPVRIVPGIAVVHLETPGDLVSFFRQERRRGLDAARTAAKRGGRRMGTTIFMAGTIFGWLAMLLGLALSAAWNCWIPACAGAVALFAGPAVIAIGESGREWRRWVPLTVVLLAYGTARAVSLLDRR
jgi:cellulose synthase/poly-beta-1,6-N-acetylglucosamine synthase-like glycosyltransferase